MNIRTAGGSLAAIASLLLIGACDLEVEEPETTAAASQKPAAPLDRIQAELDDMGWGGPDDAKVSGEPKLPVVTFTLSDGWDLEGTRDTAKLHVMDILTAVHEADVLPTNLRVIGKTTLVDQYGKESREGVLWSMFDRKTLRRINYDDASYLDPEALAESFVLHPALFD